MPLIDIDSLEIPPAPACPSWCSGHRPSHLQGGEIYRNGWIADVHSIVKWCRRELPLVDTQEHREVEIRVERFAWIDTGDDATEVHVKIDPVKVNMDFWTDMTPKQAETFADQLKEAARLARLWPTAEVPQSIVQLGHTAPAGSRWPGPFHVRTRRHRLPPCDHIW